MRDWQVVEKMTQRGKQTRKTNRSLSFQFVTHLPRIFLNSRIKSTTLSSKCHGKLGDGCLLGSQQRGHGQGDPSGTKKTILHFPFITLTSCTLASIDTFTDACFPLNRTNAAVLNPSRWTSMIRLLAFWLHFNRHPGFPWPHRPQQPLGTSGVDDSLLEGYWTPLVRAPLYLVDFEMCLFGFSGVQAISGT